MRNDRLIPGLILVLAGAVFLLSNYGYVHFHWTNFLYLWPIFFVIGGVNLIFAHNRSGWATAIKVGVVVLGFGLLLFGNFGNKYNFWPGSYYSFSDDDDNDTTSNRGTIVKVEGNSFFNEPYTSGVNSAELNISGGATTYTLNDTTNQLFSANTKEFGGKYKFSHHKDGSTEVMDFEMDGNRRHGFHWNNNHQDQGNEAVLKLNTAPEWEINVDAGAAAVNFDLTKFKVRKVKFDGGAASFDVKLGQPLATTNVEVNTGMAHVGINIPKGAACRITSDSFLISHQFDGFTKTGDDTYETPGFANARNKILISIDGAISDLSVKQY